MDSGLVGAYNNAHYHVFTPVPFFLIIGEHSEQLLNLCYKHNVKNSSYLTAYNPYSKEQNPQANEQAQWCLQQVVSSMGLRTVDGEGEDPEGVWQPEKSLLILGCTRSQGEALGKQYEQNAFVYIGEDAIPELVLLERLNS